MVRWWLLFVRLIQREFEDGVFLEELTGATMLLHLKGKRGYQEI